MSEYTMQSTVSSQPPRQICTHVVLLASPMREPCLRLSLTVPIVVKFSILIQIFRRSWFSSKLSKILISVTFFSKFWFWSQFSKISNLVNILEKSRFWSKFPIISILVKIFEKSQFCQNFVKSLFVNIFRKILILIKKKKKIRNLDFAQSFRKVSIWVKIFDNLDFSQNFKKIYILIKILGKFRFWSKFLQIALWSKLFEALDFRQNFFENHNIRN